MRSWQPTRDNNNHNNNNREAEVIRRQNGVNRNRHRNRRYEESGTLWRLTPFFRTWENESRIPSIHLFLLPWQPTPNTQSEIMVWITRVAAPLTLPLFPLNDAGPENSTSPFMVYTPAPIPSEYHIPSDSKDLFGYTMRKMNEAVIVWFRRN